MMIYTLSRDDIPSLSQWIKKIPVPKNRNFFGGDKGDRTPDLLTASQALSQLSYTPKTNAVCFSEVYITTLDLKMQVFF